MKKIRYLIAVLLVILNTAGCSIVPTNSTLKIVSPENSTAPIEGTWRIVKILGDETKKNTNTDNKSKSSKNDASAKTPNDYDEWIGKDVQFSSRFAVFGDYVLDSPGYKVVKANFDEYVMYNHKPFLEDINIPSKEIEIIIIADKDKFFCEALKISPDELVITFYNYNLYLKKVSGTVGSPHNKKLAQNGKNMFAATDSDTNISHTGVFIGLCSPVNNNAKSDTYNTSGYNYRTLWIAAVDKKLHPVLETENIFFPRRSGFWKMEVRRIGEHGHSEDTIFAYNVLKGKKTEILLYDDLAMQPQRKNSIARKINYVSNDYVSVESREYAIDSSSPNIISNKYQIIPVDGLPSMKGIKISDVLSKTGEAAMKSGMDDMMKMSGIDRSRLINTENTEENFGLVRKMGYWLFAGRVNYVNGREITAADYKISVIPPPDLVFYDELSVQWADIKDKIPDAIDAFTSPNKDIAIILVKNRLLIYAINDGVLGRVPLKKIKLRENETVVMAEWAVGNYMSSWERTFQSLK